MSVWLVVALAAAWPGAAPPVHALAVLPPQADLARRVGGPRVTVDTLVPEGVFPHAWEPTPRRLALFDGVDLVVAGGLPFEQRLFDRLRAVAGRDVRIVPPPQDAPPHFWLDPDRARAQVRALAAALAEIDPRGADDFARRAAALEGELARLADAIGQRLAACRGGAVVTLHGSLEAFAERFGLRELALEHRGHDPGPRRLAAVIGQARAAGVRAVLAERQAGRRPAEAAAAELGVPVVEIDPLFDDYPRGLRALAEAVAGACGTGGAR
ncbi:MAG: zinc ABC transporter substrate-binding protein [Acidobacteriota bacterium]